MIILGIDPGTNFLGYSLLLSDSDDLRLIDLGTLKIKNYPDPYEKLKEIFLQVQEIIEVHNPDELAIEAPFYGKNAQSMLKLGRAQGVAMAACMTMGLNITEYSPKSIKKAVTGNGNATKEQVCSLLERILDIKIQKNQLDASDALGAALCHHYALSRPVKIPKSGKGWSSFLSANKNRIVGGT